MLSRAARVIKNGLGSRRKRKCALRSAAGQLGEQHYSKNMPAQSLNWHGASRADFLQGADFMTEQTNTKIRDLVHYSKILIKFYMQVAYY